MKHQVHNFCTDFNVRGDSELCIYLLSRALVTFTCDPPHHLDIPSVTSPVVMGLKTRQFKD